MRAEPPQALIELLVRLNLATAAEVRGMYGRVKRLARELPLFESVWVDALAQTRVLSQYQAAEINAGRGQRLQVGPYTLIRRLPSPGYASCFAARQTETGHPVRLAVIPWDADRRDDSDTPLRELLAKSQTLDVEHVTRPSDCGRDGLQLWIASEHVPGQTAAEWMSHNGRFPPLVALEIARQVLVGLAEIEKAGLCHGDLSTFGLVLTDSGRVVLTPPGVRGIVRPEEGFAHADLLPEDYDYLAPERITAGTAPDIAADVYSCGALWWHLLTGRPPLPGGSSLAKLRAVQSGRIVDVRRLAPDTPEPLAEAISACLGRSADSRPESIARLAAELGPPTHAGRLGLARCIAGTGRRAVRWTVSVDEARRSKHGLLWLAALAGCAVTAVAIAWSAWQDRMALPVASIPAAAPAVVVDEPPDAEMPDATAGDVVPPERPSTPAQPAPDRDDLVLAGGTPIAVDSLELTPGRCVRGRPGERPVVFVPPDGLLVQPEGVRFERIDFVWRDPGISGTASSRRPAVIRLEASQAEFVGCSFRSIPGAGIAPVAIDWSHGVDRSRLELSLPSGRVRLRNCVFQRVSAGVASQRIGAVGIDAVNVLYLSPGALVELDHAPEMDEAVVLNLSAVTLRESGPLLECRYQEIDDRPGKILISAGQCAFVTGRDTALLRFSGPAPPDQVLRQLEWTGQGSLVSPECMIATWRLPDGSLRELDDSSASIAGLVRSAVEFEGAIELGPAASRITRWQGPLRSPNPPGVDPALLER